MVQRSTDVGREQAVCCSFVLSVVPASSSTLSLANPAVENHSMMSVHRELLPNEASLAGGSRMPILALVGSPLWEQQTTLVTTTLPARGWYTGTTSPAVPATSPTCFTDTERSYRRCSERRSTSCGAPVLCDSTFAPALPSYSPVGSFSWDMRGKQNFHILLQNEAHVSESTKVLRVGKKGVSFPNHRIKSCNADVADVRDSLDLQVSPRTTEGNNLPPAILYFYVYVSIHSKMAYKGVSNI